MLPPVGKQQSAENVKLLVIVEVDVNEDALFCNSTTPAVMIFDPKTPEIDKGVVVRMLWSKITFELESRTTR